MCPVTGTPSCGRPNKVVSTIASATTASATGRPGSKRSPSSSSAIAIEANDKHDKLHVPQLSEQQVDALEEIMTAAFHAEQFGQLRHRDRQSGADLEADQDAVADQSHQHTQPEQPGKQTQARHGERRKARDLHVARRIAFRHRTDGCLQS